MNKNIIRFIKEAKQDKNSLEYINNKLVPTWEKIIRKKQHGNLMKRLGPGSPEAKKNTPMHQRFMEVLKAHQEQEDKLKGLSSTKAGAAPPKKTKEQKKKDEILSNLSAGGNTEYGSASKRLAITAQGAGQVNIYTPEQIKAYADEHGHGVLPPDPTKVKSPQDIESDAKQRKKKLSRQQLFDLMNNTYTKPSEKVKAQRDSAMARAALQGMDADDDFGRFDEEVELDEATKAYKNPITGEVIQIPDHRRPTYGFNKSGNFATFDRVPKPRKKLHNTAHQLMRTVDEFEEGTPERQAVTDALKKVVGAIKEAKDLSKDLKKGIEAATGGKKTLVRTKSGVLVARKAKKNVQEAHIDLNFIETFGAAAAAYDHILNPLIKKAKQKVADKIADKLAKKKEAPAEQVAEASLAADIQRDVDARNKRLADAAAKTKKKKAAEAKAASAAKQAKEMENLKNLSKYGSEEEKQYARDELQRIKNLEESTQDNNYLNNKKSQIRESILSKLAAKTGKK